jgi:hypothetical protein
MALLSLSEVILTSALNKVLPADAGEVKGLAPVFFALAPEMSADKVFDKVSESP